MESRPMLSAIAGKLMLRRYDLCERAARVLWIELLKMNHCKSWRGLAEKITRSRPDLDAEKIAMMVWLIRTADN